MAKPIKSLELHYPMIQFLPTSQPSEDARLVRRQHYRAVRKYCAGGKNLELFFVR